MLGCFLAGLVRVKTKHDLIDKALQNPGLMMGESCSLRGDDIFDSRFEQTDQVELTFTDNRATRLDQRPFGFVQSKQNPSFLKKRRFRRVHIFRGLRVGLKQPAAECDYFADVVADGKHDPAAKSVIDIAAWALFIARFDQSALQELGPRVTAAKRPSQECVPAIGSKSELPILRHLPIDPAIL